MSIKTCHVLDNFLPKHTAGIEVYVLTICQSNLNSNIVLIRGEENNVYEYNGVKVYVVAENKGLLLKLKDIKQLESIKIFHYHQFQKSPLYSFETIGFLKSIGCKLSFTFHLVQYYCSTLTLRKENKYDCNITPNEDICSECVFKSNYFDKLPVFLRSYSLLKKLRFVKKIDNLFDSSEKITRKTFYYLEIILLNFDNLYAINDSFYTKLISLESNANVINFSKKHQHNKFIKRTTSDIFKIVFIGRIEKSKGIDRIVDLAKSLDDKTICIDLYGQINETKYNEEFFLDLNENINTVIEYKGLIRPDKVDSVLANYDLFIHPSLIAEMTPLVIFESFRNGVPVLGNDIFGINTYVQHGVNGWLVDFSNISNVSKLLKEIRYILKGN